MSIPVKLLLTFVACFGLMAGISLSFLQHNLTQSHEAIERRDLSMHMGRVVEGLESELTHLQSFSRDWAVWSEMYRYALQPDAAWARENIGAQALQPANLSLVMIYNARGELLSMNSRDAQGRELVLPTLPASPYIAVLTRREQLPGCGSIKTDAGLMLVCWSRITRSDGQGDFVGTVVMGRLLDPVLTLKLREQIKLPLKLQALQELPPDLTPWPDEISKSSLGNSVFSSSHDANVYHLYYPLQDVLQQPLGFVTLDVPRDVYLQGEALYRQVRFQLVVIALTMAILLGFAVHWLLIRRLRSLTGQLTQLAQGKRWDARMRMNGGDELGLVSIKVNQLLALIESQVNKLQTLTLTDELTGLPNRRAFDGRLAEEYARAQRTRHPLALLALDVDYFKRYNDHYGHPAGDVALKAVADVLRLSLSRPADFIARIGGEEFVVLLSETDAPGAQEIADRIVENFRQRALPHTDSPVAPYMTVSMGIAIAGDESKDVFWSRADIALYQAKRNGRNRAFCAVVK